MFPWSVYTTSGGVNRLNDMSPASRPLRLAIVNDYEIVVAGVAAMLAPYVERVAVVELDAGLPVVSDVDVILYDTFGQVQGDGVDLTDLVAGTAARVVIFSWNTQPDLVQRAIDKGAAGYLSKAMSAEEIVAALEAIHAGTVVTPESVDTQGRSANGEWPGREAGLTAREAEVLALITQGLSNQEIAERSYLSINSVKTYIRTAYRKVGVTRRAQAVVWGMQHGLEPDRQRSVAGADAARLSR
jgi:DNA-binding NarL/FixJ family response regulator